MALLSVLLQIELVSMLVFARNEILLDLILKLLLVEFNSVHLFLFLFKTKIEHGDRARKRVDWFIAVRKDAGVVPGRSSSKRRLELLLVRCTFFLLLRGRGKLEIVDRWQL